MDFDSQENVERTSACVVLIHLLRPLDSSMWPSPESEDDSVARNQKFSNLVVKCLIKLTKLRIIIIDFVY